MIKEKESSEKIKRDCTSWFVLPYISKISNKFKRIRTFNFKLTFTSLNKLNSLIKGHKDILLREKKKNVYKISCKSCDVLLCWTNWNNNNQSITEPNDYRTSN